LLAGLSTAARATRLLRASLPTSATPALTALARPLQSSWRRRPRRSRRSPLTKRRTPVRPRHSASRQPARPAINGRTTVAAVLPTSAARPPAPTGRQASRMRCRAACIDATSRTDREPRPVRARHCACCSTSPAPARDPSRSWAAVRWVRARCRLGFRALRLRQVARPARWPGLTQTTPVRPPARQPCSVRSREPTRMTRAQRPAPRR